MGWLQEHEAVSLCGSGLLLKASSSVLFSLGPGNSAYSVLWIAAILQTNAYCYPISLFRYLIGISNIICSKENATVIYIIKITCFQSTCSTSTGFFVLFFFFLYWFLFFLSSSAPRLSHEASFYYTEETLLQLLEATTWFLSQLQRI